MKRMLTISLAFISVITLTRVSFGQSDTSRYLIESHIEEKSVELAKLNAEIMSIREQIAATKAKKEFKKKSLALGVVLLVGGIASTAYYGRKPGFSGYVEGVLSLAVAAGGTITAAGSGVLIAMDSVKLDEFDTALDKKQKEIEKMMLELEILKSTLN